MTTPNVDPPAGQPRITPQQLLGALLAAGFTVVGEEPGSSIRMAWPPDLAVPLPPVAVSLAGAEPRQQDDISEILVQISKIVAAGKAAEAVLAHLYTTPEP